MLSYHFLGKVLSTDLVTSCCTCMLLAEVRYTSISVPQVKASIKSALFPFQVSSFYILKGWSQIDLRKWHSKSFPRGQKTFAWPQIPLTYVTLRSTKVVFKWANPGLFCLFPSFSQNNSNLNWKSVDVVLGDRTRGSKMVDVEGSTEQWRLPTATKVVIIVICTKMQWSETGIFGLDARSVTRKTIAKCPKLISLGNYRFWHLYKNCLRMWKIWAN